jgi:hypothetical protein
MDTNRALVAAIVLTLLAGCATTRPSRISDDGRTLVTERERWQVQDGLTLFERDGQLHVVSVGADASFDVVVPFSQEGRPAWPEEAPFEVADGTIRLHVKTDASVASLVESRQLHPHAEHFHLTSRYANPDWQSLYALREEGSALEPARQRLAASVLAALLDERLPGSSEAATLAALRRFDSVIAKARRAVLAGQPGQEVLGILGHDLEISEAGRLLEVEGQRFRAGEGVRFVYDGGHFHVEAEAGTWVQVVSLEAMDPGTFELPPSIFYELRNGVIEARPASGRWQALAESRQLRFIRDHWHLTETYRPLQPLALAADDPARTEAQRERARSRVLEVLRLRLDIGSELELETQLASIDRLIDRLAGETEQERRGPATAPAGKKR